MVTDAETERLLVRSVTGMEIIKRLTKGVGWLL